MERQTNIILRKIKMSRWIFYCFKQSIIQLLKPPNNHRRSHLRFSEHSKQWQSFVQHLNYIVPLFVKLFFLVCGLLRDCSLCWDRCNGTWHLHLTGPYYVAIGRVLIWVIRWIGWGALPIGFPHSQVELQCFSEARERQQVH